MASLIVRRERDFERMKLIIVVIFALICDFLDYLASEKDKAKSGE